MDTIRMSTVVFTTAEQVYEFLMDFESYGRYSEYVEDVRVSGDGSAGAEYDITFAWWRLSYTARSRVIDFEPGAYIRWEVTKDVDAKGEWRIEALDPTNSDVDFEIPERVVYATLVTLDVTFNPSSVGPDALDLPRLVSLERVITKVKPVLVEQAVTVLRRVVADLEGKPRDPEIRIHTVPESVDVDADDLNVTSDSQ